MTTKSLDKFRNLISSTFDENDVSIFHTEFFNTLKTHGWEQAREFVKELPGSNEFAASLHSSIVLIPCYVETGGRTNIKQKEENDVSNPLNETSGKWILLARFVYARKKQKHSTIYFNILDETPDNSTIKVLQSMFEGTPLALGRTKWSLENKIQIDVGMLSDSEARCAGWMGLIAARLTRVTKKYRFVGNVITAVFAAESRIDNIFQERRKWFDACIEANIFYEPMGNNKSHKYMKSETFSALQRIPYKDLPMVPIQNVKRTGSDAQGGHEDTSIAKKRDYNSGLRENTRQKKEERGNAKKRKSEKGVSNSSKVTEKTTGKKPLPSDNSMKKDFERKVLKSFFQE